MLKYKEITDRLSVKQKIALVTNVACLSDPAFVGCGIPYTAVGRIDAMMEELGEGISPLTLARAWDPELIRRLSGEMAQYVKGQGIGMLLTPTPKIKLDPCGKGATEDPFLSSLLTNSYLKAIREADLMGGVDGFYLHSGDMAHLDSDVDRRVIREYFVRPFQQAFQVKGCEAVVGSVTGPVGTVNGLNHALLKKGQDAYFTNRTVLCETDSREATVVALKEGCILLRGDATALEDAYAEYLRIQSLIEAGHASVMELDDACSSGLAITPSMLDAAVERVIDLAFLCRGERDVQEKEEGAFGDTPSRESLRPEVLPNLFDAIRQSIVLLKNEKNILPLKSGDKVAILGNVALEGQERAFAERLRGVLAQECVGVCCGYDGNLLLDEEKVAEAESLVKQADKVLLFVGESRRTGNGKHLSLPAQQLALLDRLKEYKEKIVTVLVSENPVDMRFDRFAAGVLLAPMGKDLCARALAQVLSGEFCPCGHLSESYYDDPEEVLAEQMRDKRAKRSKIGPFLGYRRYVSEQMPIRYPFGYGLSYTTFSYSNLHSEGNTIRMTVENTGSVKGCEVVQVYMGLPNSKLLRPDRELKAVVRVELAPHEKKKIEICDVDLKVYHEKSAQMIVENGTYAVYVGSSVQNIQAQTTLPVEGYVPAKAEHKKSDYLQSISNIVSDEYTLEAENKKMKKYWGWSLVGGLCLTLALLMSLSTILLETYISGALLAGIVSLFVLGVVFFLIGRRLNKKQRERLNQTQKEEAKARFETAEELDTEQITDLFVTEFDLLEAEAKEQEGEQIDPDELLRHMNRELTLASVVDRLMQFCAERGVSLKRSVATSVLSSLTSSRLLFVQSIHGEELNRFVALLSEFFGSPAYAETVTDRHLEGGQLLFVKDEEGSSTTQVMQMISHAGEHLNQIHLVVLNQVHGASMSDLLLSYVRYFNNPLRENVLSVKGMSGSYKLTENLWFVVELAEGESLESVPTHFSEVGSLIPMDYTTCDEVEEKSEHSVLGYHELMHMADQSKNYMEIPEELWKKLDGLESYVDGHSPFQIGNKLSLQMEKFLCVYCGCGQELPEAWDHAVAANLLPMMMAMTKDKIRNDERTLLETVEQLFGEDNVEVCRRVLKNIAV